MTTLPASKIEDVAVLYEAFDLQKAPEDFFPEWQHNTPLPTEEERQKLRRVQNNFSHLAAGAPFSEEATKMVVLSPLLDMADFFQPPLKIKTEEPIAISATDDDRVFTGKIDVLVVKQRLWILVIESKSTRFDVFLALPQTLTYMLSHMLGTPDLDKPVYGLMLNGREFVFLKMAHQSTPVYAHSGALDIAKEDELAQVLGALKNIKQVALGHSPC